MTHTTGLPMIAVGTPAWGVEVNEAFTEANRRLTLNGLLGPLPRVRSTDHEAFDGETPSWVGQTYVQTNPFLVWVSVGLTVDDWRRVDSVLQLVGALSPLHTEVDDVVTNAGIVPAFIGQTYFQTLGAKTWTATSLENTSWVFPRAGWISQTYLRNLGVVDGVRVAHTINFTAREFVLKVWTGGGGGAGSSGNGSFSPDVDLTIGTVVTTLPGGAGGGRTRAQRSESPSFTVPGNFPNTSSIVVIGAGVAGGSTPLTSVSAIGGNGNYYEFNNSSDITINTTIILRLQSGGSGSGGGVSEGASGTASTALLRYR